MSAISDLIERLEYEIAMTHPPRVHWPRTYLPAFEKALKWAKKCAAGDIDGEAPSGWRERLRSEQVAASINTPAPPTSAPQNLIVGGHAIIPGISDAGGVGGDMMTNPMPRQFATRVDVDVTPSPTPVGRWFDPSTMGPALNIMVGRPSQPIDPISQALVKGELGVGTHGLPVDPPRAEARDSIDLDATTLRLLGRERGWSP